jgi:outer membrane protein TolC
MKINPWSAAAGSLRRPHPREEGGGPAGKAWPALMAMLMIAVWFAITAPVFGEEASPPAASPEAAIVNGPVNYDRAVQLALLQSPFFTQTSLEIEIKRLDEKDSKFDLVPPIRFRTQYYVSRPTINGERVRPYSLNFTSNNYNPVESYFSLQARKKITQIAILAHMQIIADGIQKLGRMFLELEALSQTASRQKDLMDLALQNLDYSQNRLRIGTGTPLEVKVANMELEAAKMEMDRIAFSQKRLQGRIKTFIGMKPNQTLELDFKDAGRQVRGGFDTETASLEQAKSRSYIIKMLELKKELQAYNIMMAKARLFPSMFLGLTTADPLSGVTTRELFFSVGLEVPVWDGFKRVRNISRQKTILRQYTAETDEKTMSVAEQWSEAQENLRAAMVARAAAQTQEELARLQERQSEIRYRSGGEPISVFLAGRKGLVDAQRNASKKNLDYNLAVLGLRYLSGDLGANYVDTKSWQE